MPRVLPFGPGAPMPRRPESTRCLSAREWEVLTGSRSALSLFDL